MPRGGARPGAGRKSMSAAGGRSPRTQLQLEREVVARIDAARAQIADAKGTTMTRSAFLRMALERSLDRAEGGRAPRLAEVLGEGMPKVAIGLKMAPELGERLRRACAGAPLTQLLRGAALDLADEVLGGVGAAAAGGAR